MERLKKFRNDLGLTQEKMAEEMKVSLSMYEKVEGGRANASAGFMKRLKNAFPAAKIDVIFFEESQQ